MKPIRFIVITLTVLTFAALFVSCEEDGLSIRSVSPGSGIIGGNEPVKLDGAGFRQGMGIDVYFGAVKAPSVVVEGKNRLVVTTPSVAKAGIVDVRIQTDQGKAIVLPNAFRYVENQNWDLTEGFAGQKSKR